VTGSTDGQWKSKRLKSLMKNVLTWVTIN